ncbi:T9SS type A sorting domain-containing protein [Ulvibacter antarcticus]|uniref:Putative secreted protein (Por secretion system target) n=1 Tax=Ulvibacter antarcticus TaxID=442714 RepID=A0A3L9YDG9_9FLAO|nr:T9SS type A sorting domain-containing protein [Ulvibacter antarcticus]RMA58746.1 putative secreted protein (Por secretion system target) [Ulvibacter antarcticus]
MKKKLSFIKSLLIICLLLGAASVQAQVELKVLTQGSTRFSDVNDAGFGITVNQYYDFATNQLTPIESDAFSMVAINNNENVAGTMFYDEPNFILQAAYRIGGIWNPIGYLPTQDPSTDEYTVYGISPNSQYITGQTNIGFDYGGFLFDTQSEVLIGTFDPEGEASASYAVNDNGIMVGWVDRPDSGGTLRVPAYRTLDGEYHFIPEGQLPVLSGDNTIGDINSSNVMVGDFDLQPFIFDMATNTFTSFENPVGAQYAAFTSISDNGVVVGFAEVDFQVRDAIIYHPSLGSQPLYLKDVLADNGVTVNTSDGLLGTAISVSPNGQYIAGWVNGPPPFAEGWMVNLDDLIVLGVQNVSHNNISFYPNPVENILYLNSKEAIDSVAVCTITGQEVSNFTLSENLNELNLANLASGVYLVKVLSNGSVENLKIVKQ